MCPLSIQRLSPQQLTAWLFRGVNVFGEPAQGQVSGNYAQFARAHSCIGFVTLLQGSTFTSAACILMAKLGDYQLIGKKQLICFGVLSQDETLQVLAQELGKQIPFACITERLKARGFCTL
jgi:hypothetical protein